MTPVSIITDLLRAIPAWVRSTLLTLYAVVVVAFAVLGIFEVETVLGLDRGHFGEALVYIGGYLGVQSVANVEPTVEDPE